MTQPRDSLGRWAEIPSLTPPDGSVTVNITFDQAGPVMEIDTAVERDCATCGEVFRFEFDRFQADTCDTCL